MGKEEGLRIPQLNSSSITITLSSLLNILFVPSFLVF
jgi:hypothetical protein